MHPFRRHDDLDALLQMYDAQRELAAEKWARIEANEKEFQRALAIRAEWEARQKQNVEGRYCKTEHVLQNGFVLKGIYGGMK